MSDRPSPAGDGSVANRTYAALRRAILEGEYLPGDRLTGPQLAHALGVSRTPVRAALLKLDADGLVETSDNQSARVRALTVEDMSQAYDVAEGLESVVVHRVTNDAAAEDLESVRSAALAMRAAADVGDKHAWVEADEQFHELLRNLSANDLLRSMLQRVDSVVTRVRFLSISLYPEGANKSSSEHVAVAEAMIDGKADEARSLHQAHWSRVHKTNVELLRESLITMSYVRESGPPQPRRIDRTPSPHMYDH